MFDLARRALFCLPADTSHEFTLHALALAERGRLLSGLLPSVPDKPVRVFGIDFRNPVGLAAGLDKNGECIDAFAALGFGFIEVGTVTPRPQPGNPLPRIFRLPERSAIINRMGFNNHGVDALVANVRRARYRGVLGINIGKNKDTPNEQALDDYLFCLRKVYDHATYVTVNISSPNTPGLRTLQHGDALRTLLGGLREEQERLQRAGGRRVPLLVKIAPDSSDNELAAIAAALVEFGIDGVIATNTTSGREGVQGLRHAEEAGGLSGAPLTPRSTAVIATLAAELAGRVPIIGVGGILGAEDALAKREAGAALVQIYTGFIYRGPGLIREIVRAW
ncbi:MAG: quinone-dependent dihydroorotate dehydrogenase [Pseudomonadota bacterium]